MAIPGLADAIEATIRDALEGSLMWPARNIIPMLPGDYSNLELRPAGILEVKLLQAKNLKNKEIIGKSDPFCVIYVRPMRDRMKKSRTINNELNPVWNEHFEFEVEDISTQYLQIKIFDDGIQGSNIMGCARVKLEDLESGKLKDLWLRVVKDFNTTCDRNYRGEVHIELRYLSFGMEHESMISLTRNATTLLEKAFAHDMNGQAVSSLEYVNSSKRRHRIVRGVLSVTVKRAENLIVADFLGSSDPFVMLTMKKSGSMKKTKVVPKSLNPIWDQTFHFMVEDALHDLLIVEVWDHDTFGKDSLGKCVVSLSKLILQGEYDTDLKLEGVESGQIFLQLNWKPQPYSHDDS